MVKHPDRLGVSLPEEQKEKWEEYVENTDAYASVSDLVRKSVENEIGLDDRTREMGELKEELVTLFSAIDSRVQNLNNNVDELKDGIPSDEDLYDISHDSNIDAIDKMIDDADASTDYYRR